VHVAVAWEALPRIRRGRGDHDRPERPPHRSRTGPILVRATWEYPRVGRKSPFRTAESSRSACGA
jgi:hypothetical protein